MHMHMHMHTNKESASTTIREPGTKRSDEVEEVRETKGEVEGMAPQQKKNTKKTGEK